MPQTTFLVRSFSSSMPCHLPTYCNVSFCPGNSCCGMARNSIEHGKLVHENCKQNSHHSRHCMVDASAISSIQFNSAVTLAVLRAQIVRVHMNFAVTSTNIDLFRVLSSLILFFSPPPALFLLLETENKILLRNCESGVCSV